MKAYKATNSGMTCLDFQYRLNKVFELDGEIIPCEHGFHSCAILGDVLGYYSQHKGIRFFEVEIPDDSIVHDDKFVSNEIEFIREIFKNEYEEEFSKNYYYSFLYARDVLKGRFEQGEEAISKKARYSYLYAMFVLKGRFEQGEEAISKKSYYSKLYAVSIIEGRFEQGEEAISKSGYYPYSYWYDIYNE